ncbi:hypothetical protein [Saccharothrix sp.]|uniref:hypothetical protein n=1 Tax=Saccharothrix sp. TaxID=1873460 RepID=UPI002811A1A9|nr:hypothetical protein [Saccharothrix sp.]
MARRPVLPLVVAGVLVPTAVTAFGFTVYGDEITGALPFTSSAVPSSHLVRPPSKLPIPSRPTATPEVVAPPPSPEVARQNVASLFASNAVKGITFAPGTTDHIGRGEAVQTGVGNLLGGVPGAVVTLVAHAWNGETTSHRCDVLAMRRALLVRDYLVARGVPAEAISTQVVVDPVWGPPSEAGPQVDVLVG